MKLWIASDHAGFDLKQFLQKHTKVPIQWTDLGTHSHDSVHYPDFGKKLALEVLKGGGDLNRPCGVLICGSGIGVSIAANRFKGIRAALCTSAEMATLSRKHNAANVLCLGARLFADPNDALDILTAWMSTEFEGGRHAGRTAMLDS